MGFQLDVSGGVQLTDTKWVRIVQWSDLDRFTQGYVEALMGSPLTLRGPLPKWPGFSDLAPETLARIMEDCATYLRTRIPPFQGHDNGAWVWTERQVGHLPDLPPLTVILCDDGKVRFADQIAARPLAVAS